MTRRKAAYGNVKGGAVAEPIWLVQGMSAGLDQGGRTGLGAKATEDRLARNVVINRYKNDLARAHQENLY